MHEPSPFLPARDPPLFAAVALIGWVQRRDGVFALPMRFKRALTAHSAFFSPGVIAALLDLGAAHV
jgi:hypothetical protein